MPDTRPSEPVADGRGSIIDTAVLEIGLLGLLHLHNEAAPVLRHAIDIEHGTAVAKAVAQVLSVEILDILNLLLAAIQQGIQETDEQVLVHLSAEKLLEAEIGVRIDVSLARIVCHNPVVFVHFVQQIYDFFLYPAPLVFKNAKKSLHGAQKCKKNAS